jgi:arylsulfatase A-like enzyme
MAASPLCDRLFTRPSSGCHLKVQAVLNWIDGKKHDGSANLPAVPAIFGMNFQAVSIGQKLEEKSVGITGGYLDSQGTPSPALQQEIQYVDSSIGRFVAELKKRNLFDSTLIVITAKHGQSPIDPKRVLRIPADAPNLQPPSAVVANAGIVVAQALEDDVSLIWLADQAKTAAAVAALEANEDLYGGGEIFSGPSLELLYNSPLVDPRTPDIIVAPNAGVVYTGGTKKVAEHGGSAQDDRNVMLLLSHPSFNARTITLAVETRQVAPTILRALGLDPHGLIAVQKEGTQPLPFSF